MSDIKKLAAFPRTSDGNSRGSDGMALRDYFAAKSIALAMKYCEDGYCGDEWGVSTVGFVAYELADALLKARGEK